jgi:hypothetical protein
MNVLVVAVVVVVVWEVLLRKWVMPKLDTTVRVNKVRLTNLINKLKWWK